MKSNPKPGSHVLVRATRLGDGKLLVAPGAYIEADGVDIVVDDVPGGIPDRPSPMLMMFFRSERERSQFADDYGAAGTG